mgnify:CR=1 FL=1
MFKKKTKGRAQAKVGDSFLSFAGAILAILAFRWLLFEPFVIPSGSMIPTLLIHDHILVQKFAYGFRIPLTKKFLAEWGGPKRGEIVVFKSVQGSYFMIKRVVGLAGDKIEMLDDGNFLVNGEKFETKPLPVTSDPASQAPYYAANEGDLQGPVEDFEFYEEKTGAHVHRMLLIKDTVGRHYKFAAPGDPFVVPPNALFAMGDNRDNSGDSRIWGHMPRENLMGKALFVWLSCEETLPYIPFICNLLTLRWKRFGHVLE